MNNKIVMCVIKSNILFLISISQQPHWVVRIIMGIQNSLWMYQVEWEKTPKRAVGVNLGIAGPGLETLEEHIIYIENAKNYGFSEVRMPVDITNEKRLNSAKIVFDLETITEIVSKAKKLGMNTTLGINPETDAKVGASPGNLKPYAETNVNCVRPDTDLGYTPKELAQMTNNPYNLNIGINASHANVGLILKEMKKQNANFERIIGWFNQYPHPESGLSLKSLIKNAKEFKKYGVEVRCNIGFRSTVEKHKKLSLARAAEEIFATRVIDCPFVTGIATLNDMKKLKEVIERDSIKIRIEVAPNISDLERRIVFEGVHINRIDAAECVIRSQLYRGTDLPPHNILERPKYTVTIDNRLLGHYSGELIMNLVDLPADKRFNVIGHVIEEDQNLVDMIGPACKFVLDELH